MMLNQDSRRKVMKIMMLLTLCSSFSAVAFAADGPVTPDRPACEEAQGTGATPFQLAYDYRFVACRQAGSNLRRAAWILRDAAATGKIACDQVDNEELKYDVARFLRGYCRL
jgi:hypothetical protein